MADVALSVETLAVWKKTCALAAAKDADWALFSAEGEVKETASGIVGFFVPATFRTLFAEARVAEWTAIAIRIADGLFGICA